jgi:hypothetical protein
MVMQPAVVVEVVEEVAVVVVHIVVVVAVFSACPQPKRVNPKPSTKITANK